MSGGEKRRATESGSKQPLPRRLFLQGSAAVGLAGVASGTGSARQRQGERPAYTGKTWAVPTDVQFNPYSSQTFDGDTSLIIFDPYAKYDPVAEEFVPVVASEWSVDGTTMTLAVSDEHVWHDGEPVTAADVVADLRLELFMEGSIAEFVADVEAVDERTVELTLTGEVNREVLFQTLFGSGTGRRLDVKRSVFEAQLDAFADASTDEETEDAQRDLLELTLDEPVGNGPFELADRTEQKFLFERFDEYPAADEIAFDYELQFGPSNQEHWQGVISGQIDGLADVYAPPEILDQFPDHVVEIRNPAYTGSCLVFRHDSDAFGDRNVRKAFAHIIDREPVGEVIYTPVDMPVDVPTGIPSGEAEKWLGESIAEFDAYEPDAERAASLLREAGYRQENGSWVDENGDPLSGQIHVPAGFTNQVQGFQHIAGTLREFGIDAEIQTVENASYFGSVLPEGQFELGWEFWGGWNPHPYFGLRDMLVGVQAGNYNYPAEVSVPPVGEPGGESRSVNVDELITDLSQANEEERVRGIVRQLAWVFNRTLPVLPIVEKSHQTWLGTDEWKVPAEDDQIMSIKRPPEWLPRAGRLEPAESG